MFIVEWKTSVSTKWFPCLKKAFKLRPSAEVFMQKKQSEFPHYQFRIVEV